MDGIDGLAAGDPVTAEQMRALFGCGLHPLAELRQQQLEGPDLTLRDFQDAARLGRRSRSSTVISARSGSRWPRRIAAINTRGRLAGRRADAGLRSGAGADRGGPGILPG